jgi:plasmid stabilization system protein ParE
MNYSVEILPQALDNIESAYRWIADNYSAENAEQWYEELMTAVQSLKNFLIVRFKRQKLISLEKTFVSYL